MIRWSCVSFTVHNMLEEKINANKLGLRFLYLALILLINFKFVIMMTVGGNKY